MSGEKRTTSFQNGLIWFGAGVSIAEILTGTYFAPLGFAKGLAAILIGHVIGCAMFFFSGLIGGRTRKSAMESVKLSFGGEGGLIFAALNVLQLVGWTAIMIYDGAAAIDGIFPGHAWVWCLVIGALILMWIAIGITNLGPVNQIAMAALFILTIVMCRVIFAKGSVWSAAPTSGLSFGAAIELAVAMPLSWLPLISDYTREAEKPFAATMASTLVYGGVSTWMYIIGMGAALLTGGGNIAAIMVKAGLGIAALVIVILSTVTTTFLDAWSAGISTESLWKPGTGKNVALIATVIGMVLAMIFPMDDITDFLYLIGSVFAPMIAVQIADYFILKKADSADRPWNVRNLVVWAIGFVLYRLLMKVDLPVGSTLPDMAVTMVILLIASPKTKKA